MHDIELPAGVGLWLTLLFAAFCAVLAVSLCISMRREVLRAGSSLADKVVTEREDGKGVDVGGA